MITIDIFGMFLIVLGSMTLGIMIFGGKGEQ